MVQWVACCFWVHFQLQSMVFVGLLSINYGPMGCIFFFGAQSIFLGYLLFQEPVGVGDIAHDVIELV